MASNLPKSILEASEEAMKEIVPRKSNERYVGAYNKFLDWRKSQQTESFEEEVFLAYFEEKSRNNMRPRHCGASFRC